MKAPKSPPKLQRPVIIVDLQGGVVHSIQASDELKNALIIFSGDSQDCGHDEKIITLNPEFPDFIYTVSEVHATLTAGEEKFLLKQAKKYARSR